MAGDSAGGVGTEGTAGSPASGGSRIAGHLPASFCVERPARTEYRGDGGGAGDQSRRRESPAAPCADDAAKTAGAPSENDGPGTQRVLPGNAIHLECKP